MPEFLEQNNFRMDDEEFEDFRQMHLNMKKKVELDIIQANRQWDVVNQVLEIGEDEPGYADRRKHLQYLRIMAERITRAEGRKQKARRRASRKSSKRSSAAHLSLIHI